ncbi:MAG: class I SAM-dependent methyltransferase [Nitrospira sp.]
MNLKDTYNKIAEDWVKDHNNDTWWVAGTDYFLSQLPRGSKILDVGCGGGIKTKYISEKGYKVLGIDFSEKMIEIAKRENPGVDFMTVDMFDIDTIQQSFDGIFAQASLLHIPKNKVLEVLEKMKDKLNADGLLYVAVKDIKDNKIEEEVKVEDHYGYEYERFFSYFSLGELVEYFKKLNMDVVWSVDKDTLETPWVQVIGKKN